MEVNVTVDEGLEGCPEVVWFQRIAKQALTAEKVMPNAEVSLLITTQEKIRELNRTYRNVDRPTDVLSFAMQPGEDEGAVFIAPPDGSVHLGDVIISYPQAVIQAKESNHSVKKELALLLVHGLLHILGYDHEETEEERRMRAREAEILAGLKDLD